MKKVICIALAMVLVLSTLPVIAVMAAKEMFQVSTVTITGIDTPYAGKKPDLTAMVPDGASYKIKESGIFWAEYDADWEWQRDLEASDAFRAGYIYVVWVELYVTNNVSFTKSTSAAINGENAKTSGWSEDLKKMTAYYAFDLCKTAIESVALTVVEPIVGKTPTFAKVSTDQYESRNSDPKPSNQSNGVVWTNMDTSVNLSVSNQFKENGKYSVTYALYPKEGYAFSEKLTATINGKTALTRHEDGYVRIRLENMTPSYSTITPVTITGVTEPVVGKTPDYSVVAAGNNFVVQGQNDDRWVNGVAWVEFVPGAAMGTLMKTTDTFKAGNRYSIYVDLASTNTSYVFDSEKTQGTLNGKAASVMSEGKIARVIYSFGVLTQITVSNVEIHVTAPAAGVKPTFDKIDAAGYYSDNNGNPVAIYKNGVAWYKTAYSYVAAGTAETFEAGKSYTLKINLLSKDGYAFSQTLTATINGKPATVTQNDDGSVLLEIVLNTPMEPHTHAPSEWMSDDLDHWKICTDVECGAIVIQKEMHLNTGEDGKCDTCGYQLPIEVPEPSDPTVPNVTEPDATEPDGTDPTPQPSEPGQTVPATDPSEPQSPDSPTADDKQPADNNGWIWAVTAAAAVSILGALIIGVIKKKK